MLAERAVDALEHAVRAKTRGLDLEHDVHGASRALEELVSIVAKAPRLRFDTTREDRFREEKILQRLAARFRVDEKDVRQRLSALRRRSRSRTRAARPEDVSGGEGAAKPREEIEPAQRELLELLIAHPDCLPAVRAELDPQWLSPGPCRQVYETCCRLSDEGTRPEFNRLMLEFDQPAIKSLLVEFDEQGSAKAGRDAAPEALLRELIGTLKQKEQDQRRPAQIVALREGRLDDSQETELLENIIRQERSRQGISKPTDG